MDSQTIVIDGYNVIRQVPALLAAERHGLATGRDALLSQVVACYHHTPHRVLVVFDGDQTRETVTPLRCGAHSQLIFSARGQTADSVIERLVVSESRAGRMVIVATNDLAVRLATQHDGAATTSARELAARLNAPPRHLQRAARHRAAVRAQLERDAGDDDDTTARGARHKGNPHRAPRRRHGRQDPNWSR